MWPARYWWSFNENPPYYISSGALHASRGYTQNFFSEQCCVFETLPNNQNLCGLNFQGTPEAAKYIPVPVLFSPLFLLQVVGILFAASKLVEKFVLLLRGDDETGLYFRISSKAHECLGFLHHGTRL